MPKSEIVLTPEMKEQIVKQVLLRYEQIEKELREIDEKIIELKMEKKKIKKKR
ncbi:hypothetical protein ES703_11027 [subsurface metagenome]